MRLIDYHEESENEVWFDYKEDNGRFPKHDEDMNGEVIVHRIEDIKNN